MVVTVITRSNADGLERLRANTNDLWSSTTETDDSLKHMLVAIMDNNYDNNYTRKIMSMYENTLSCMYIHM